MAVQVDRGVNVAVVGATGLVGETLLDVLHERSFPVAQVLPLASQHSMGETVGFAEARLDVQPLDDASFDGMDVVFFCVDAAISRQHVARARAVGALVIDLSTAYRMDPDVPLVVPEINAHDLPSQPRGALVANPNCSAVQLCLALQAVMAHRVVTSVIVSTYQAVSGYGRAAMDTLVEELAEVLNGRPTTPRVFPDQIAFNVLPLIGEPNAEGFSEEEQKLVEEPVKILGQPSLHVVPTAVRVPVLYGHGQSVHAAFEGEPASAEVMAQWFREDPHVAWIDTSLGPTPFQHGNGSDQVAVGRVRVAQGGLSFWTVSDNLRKGGALNAVQIAEALLPGLLTT